MDETKKTILLVEDEAALRNVLRDKLVQEGYAVLEGEDGESGLAIALAKHPDLILLDILMPRLGGLEVLKRLRDDQWGKDATVFILTNVSDQEKIAEAVVGGSYEFLIKSNWKLEDIVAKIKAKLDKPNTPT